MATTNVEHQDPAIQQLKALLLKQNEELQQLKGVIVTLQKEKKVIEAKAQHQINQNEQRTPENSDAKLEPSNSNASSSSLADSHRARKRKRKKPSVKMQTLRKGLLSALKQHDKALLAGKYHKGGRLCADELENLTGTMIQNQLKEVFGDKLPQDDLPQQAFFIVMDICQKRFQYAATPSVQQQIQKQKQVKKRSRRKRLKKTPRKQIKFGTNYTAKDRENLLTPRRSPRNTSTASPRRSPRLRGDAGQAEALKRQAQAAERERRQTKEKLSKKKAHLAEKAEAIAAKKAKDKEAAKKAKAAKKS